jgi:hypothetical protein
MRHSKHSEPFFQQSASDIFSNVVTPRMSYQRSTSNSPVLGPVESPLKEYGNDTIRFAVTQQAALSNFNRCPAADCRGFRRPLRLARA